MAWNDERVAMLKSLYAEGWSATEIAGKLGGTTRNAVIGKVTRLGLCRDIHRSPKAHRGVSRPKRRPLAAPGTDARLVRPSEGPAPWKVKSAATEPVPPPRPDDIPTKTFDDLEWRDDCCRHRIDVPFKGEPYGFCGKETLPGLSVCEQHAARWFSNWPVIKHRFVKEKTKEKELEAT